MRIYVASSWRNKQQPHIVEALRSAGHKVYDFRDPGPRSGGFQWTLLDPEWKSWDIEAYRKALEDPIAFEGFWLDFGAMNWCEVCVLVMPCGRSAHLELGWAVGACRHTAVLLTDAEPELMYKMCNYITDNIEDLISWLETLT